jgi:hypothetical protein
VNRSPFGFPLQHAILDPRRMPQRDEFGRLLLADDIDHDSLSDPPRYSEVVNDGTRDWRDRTEAREIATKYPGDGQARTLTTQSGAVARLMQGAMFQDGGVYTIVFDVIYPAGLIFACQAMVRWSENGNTVQRIFDVVKGASISTPGRVLDITVFDTTPATLPLTESIATPGAGTEYTVTALVERGNRPAENKPPTFYGGIGIIPATDTETIQIPYEAGVMSLLVTATENAALPTVKPNIFVSFTTAAGGTFGQYDPSVTGGFVPIPPSATEIKITNADSENGAIVSLYWGVDG